MSRYWGDSWVAALTAVVALAVVGLVDAAVPAAANPGAGISVAVDMPYGGNLRSVRVYVSPKVPPSTPVPLLLVLHGLYLDPQTTEAASGMDVIADTEDVAVAYPEGLDGSWNAGTCCGNSSAQRVDDVGFLAHVVRVVSDLRPIDQSRIYIAGFSNGGMMALKAVCDRPDVFAAAASVSGTLQAPCKGSAPVSAILIHGLRDRTVPFEGAPYSHFLHTRLTSVPQSVLALTRRSRCTTMSRQALPAAHVLLYGKCSRGAAVELVTVPDMAHCWPTRQSDRLSGATLAWSFLRARQLN